MVAETFIAISASFPLTGGNIPGSGSGRAGYGPSEPLAGTLAPIPLRGRRRMGVTGKPAGRIVSSRRTPSLSTGNRSVVS